MLKIISKNCIYLISKLAGKITVGKCEWNQGDPGSQQIVCIQEIDNGDLNQCSNSGYREVLRCKFKTYPKIRTKGLADMGQKEERGGKDHSEDFWAEQI